MRVPSECAFSRGVLNDMTCKVSAGSPSNVRQGGTLPNGDFMMHFQTASLATIAAPVSVALQDCPAHPCPPTAVQVARRGPTHLTT